MGISQLDPDRERVELLAIKLKKLYEETMLRDPKLNTETTREILAIKQELLEMGLEVTVETSLNNLENPSDAKITADVTVWIPVNTTIQ